MMDNVFPLVIGLLIVVGGFYTIYAAKKYFKYVRTEGTNNVFSPLAVYYGFAFGVMLILLGITVLCNLY